MHVVAAPNSHLRRLRHDRHYPLGRYAFESALRSPKPPIILYPPAPIPFSSSFPSAINAQSAVWRHRSWSNHPPLKRDCKYQPLVSSFPSLPCPQDTKEETAARAARPRVTGTRSVPRPGMRHWGNGGPRGSLSSEPCHFGHAVWQCFKALSD